MDSYDFKKIEKKWQEVWKKSGYGKSEDFSKNPKHYNLVEFPYPSGSGLHVGHCMGYGASDAYCRMKRMQGFNVMYPMGWDAFGLPTENYAIQNKVKPQEITAESIITFKKQMKSLGYSFDWSREINTTDPNYYKWTQWIFLQFYKHGYKDGKLIEIADDDTTTPRLAYHAEMPVNWCPSCKINLANEEVIASKCERCGTQTEKRMQTQWLLRITAYADRLIDDLEKVDYEERIKTQQINWIGRSEGANIKFPICMPKGNSQFSIEVFTTRADTLFGATYMVVAPESDLISKIKDQILNIEEVERYIENAKNKSDLERTELEKDKTGVELKGISAINPINNGKIPVWIADYVLATYGTGACMAVPAHDKRDFAFAKKYDLEIRQTISKNRGDDIDLEETFVDYGYLINSDEFNDLKSEDAKKKITEKLKKSGAGDFAINYKLRDWIFSRQHYWGEPIPIIYCHKCWKNQKSNLKNQNEGIFTIINGEEYTVIPVPENQLPLELPEVENYEPSNTGESPLAKIDSWVNTTCPKCGEKARRETDTMPNWAGSSWYYLAYSMLGNQKLKSMPEGKNQKDGDIFSNNPGELKYWLPVDIYNGGMEHTTLHLLYSRFWHKFLFDLKIVPGAEPYQKRIAHGIILGPDRQKMSKSRGNVINPDEMIEQFGADTLRAYIMFIGPYDQESAWNMTGIRGVFRFLNRVWNNAGLIKDRKNDDELLIKLNQTIKGVTEDLESYQLNTIISKLMEFNNLIEKKKSISKESFASFLKLLYPVCPHIAEELWEQSGFNGTIEKQDWPAVDKNYLIGEKITIVIQINGKLKDTIEVEKDTSEEKVKELAMTERIKSFVDKGKIKNIIYVPGKIVNFVVE